MADRIGRTKTLLITILIYSIGTTACALAPNIWSLMLFRVLVGLGYRRRVGGRRLAGGRGRAGASAGRGRGDSLHVGADGIVPGLVRELSDRWPFFQGHARSFLALHFLFGLIPTALAFVIRMFIKEPERWKDSDQKTATIKELFDHRHFRLTLSGFLAASIALITWWSCNAFISVVTTGLAQARATELGLDRIAALTLTEEWKKLATNLFNLGGLIGTMLTIPVAKCLGRKVMLAVYFLFSSLSIFIAFGFDLSNDARLYHVFSRSG